jgi:limonene-1,2-epoxide hydrolase
MRSNLETVLAFLEAIHRNDQREILGFFTEDAVFHNIPMEPARGHEAIWSILALVHETAEEIDWRLHSIAEAADGKVLTERTDRYRLNGTWVEFPLMGIFELRDGRICAWRDYFDLAQSNEQMRRAGLG